MKAVIVAAGMGSRLMSQKPKTLLPFGDRETILSTILKNLRQVGIRDIVIVIGFQPLAIQEYLAKNENFGLNITFVKNGEWERGNGISVLAAQVVVTNERFLLSMSDHIVSANALRTILSHNSEKNLLLVDPKIDQIFDIDDATKVEHDKGAILKIGKELAQYNGIDCGIFVLNQRFFDSMQAQLRSGKESISAAIQGLIANDDMEAVLLGDHDYWIDVDTPASYEFALKHLAK